MLDVDGFDPTKLATLVVAETHSACEVPFARLRGLAFLQQEQDEAPTSLASHVERVVHRLQTEALHVRHAWLLLNAEHDDALNVARHRIAGMLGEAVSRSGGGELTIVAVAGASALQPAAVLSLAGLVLEEPAQQRVTVHVRFVAASRALPAERRAPRADRAAAQRRARAWVPAASLRSAAGFMATNVTSA